MKKLLIIALSMLLLSVSPAVASEFQDDPETEMTGVNMSIKGSQVRIQNADGMTLEVYNLTGVRVSLIKIDGSDKQITLNLSHGCYILRVGKVVRKVTIR